MSTGRPLRPLALVWAGFGIVPWTAAALLMDEPNRAASVAGTVAGLLPLLSLLAVVLVVRARTVVRWPRIATGAAFVTFLVSVVRFGVLPFTVDSILATPDTLLRQEEVARFFGYLLFLGASFLAACLVLGVVCGHALVREWTAR